MASNIEGNVSSKIHEKAKDGHLIQVVIFIINIDGQPRCMRTNAYKLVVLVVGR